MASPPSEVEGGGQVTSMERVHEHNVSIVRDERKCHISGICRVSGGNYIIVDYTNCRVKLLDRQYVIKVHWDLPRSPRDVCLIDDNKVSVTCLHRLKPLNV